MTIYDYLTIFGYFLFLSSSLNKIDPFTGLIDNYLIKDNLEKTKNILN